MRTVSRHHDINPLNSDGSINFKSIKAIQKPPMLLKSVHESCNFQEQEVQVSLPAQKSNDQAALSGFRSERQIFS